MMTTQACSKSDPSPFAWGLRVGVLCGLILLSACASNDGQTVSGGDWIRSDGKGDVKADQALCQATARSEQGRQADSFSDPRYGAVNAMAAALGKDDVANLSAQSRRLARFELCMQGVGWHRATAADRVPASGTTGGG